MISFSDLNIMKYLMILEKNEHQITSRETKLPEVINSVLLSVIIDHW